MHRIVYSLFLFVGLAGLVILTEQAVAFDGNAKTVNGKNVIVIMTDDQRWDTLSMMPTVRDELVANGILFENAFATTPLCCPSRASYLTGLFAYEHEVRSNNGPANGQALDDSHTLATVISDNTNYRTGYIGKYMHGYLNLGSLESDYYVPPGWDLFDAFAHRDPETQFYYNFIQNEDGTAVAYGDSPEDYSTDVLARKAVEFIGSSGSDPFFLTFAPYAPHKPYLPAERHAGAFDEIAPARPPNFDEADLSDKPPWFSDVPSLDVPAVDELRKDYLESLLAVDDAVAAILSALQENNHLNDTVIIFTSDNGYALGEHGLVGKNCAYEECIRIPLVIWYPRITDGSVRSELVLNIDLAPTIAHLAGARGLLHSSGRSLLALRAGSASNWRSDALIEHWETFTLDPTNLAGIIPDYRALRTDQWKFVEQIDGELELYDLLNDPYEMENLAYEPDYALTTAWLQARTEALRPFWSPLPVPQPEEWHLYDEDD